MMFRLRKKILLNDPDLAALHRAVVIKGKLSENDFWASRQASCFSTLVPPLLRIDITFL